MLAPSLFRALKVKYQPLELGPGEKNGSHFLLRQHKWTGHLVGLFSFSPKIQVFCVPLKGWERGKVEQPEDRRDCSHKD